MFKNLNNFLYKRKGKEIFGFYLAYLVFGMVLGAIAGGASSYFTNAQTYAEGLASGAKIGSYIAPLYIIILTFLVIRGRKATDFGSILIGLVGILLTLLGGSFLGLIPVAILTARGR